jgi:integrase
MSESRLLYPFVMLCHETGARSGVVKSLQWERIDFAGGGLRFAKDKTKAGSWRTIPISRRAMATLEVWAANFPHRKPKDYVFPSEVYKQVKGGGMVVVSSDPTKSLTSLQRSWETTLERAAWILAGRPDSMDEVEPFECRFHDLRPNAVSRMIANKVPIPIIAVLVGWSPSTMWAMAARYGHYDIDTLREAVECISGDANLSGPPIVPPVMHSRHRVESAKLSWVRGCLPGIRTPIDRFRADCPTIERGGNRLVRSRGFASLQAADFR